MSYLLQVRQRPIHDGPCVASVFQSGQDVVLRRRDTESLRDPVRQLPRATRDGHAHPGTVHFWTLFLVVFRQLLHTSTMSQTITDKFTVHRRMMFRV